MPEKFVDEQFEAMIAKLSDLKRECEEKGFFLLAGISRPLEDQDLQDEQGNQVFARAAMASCVNSSPAGINLLNEVGNFIVSIADEMAASSPN